MPCTLPNDAVRHATLDASGRRSVYSKEDFNHIRASLKALLKSPSGEPVICELYTCENAPGAATVQYADGTTSLHVAEACNVAGVINSLERIVSLPRSNIACEELSEVMLLRLDVLREYIRDLRDYPNSAEARAEAMIRWWAGFLKHPRGFVLAHRCFGAFDEVEGSVILNTEAVERFSNIRGNAQKDAAKDKYRNQPVKVVLPSVGEIEEFFRECRHRMQLAIEEFK